MIPFASLARKCRRFRKPVQQAVARVFRRGWFILGPEVRAFEGAFARYLGVRHVIGVNSGTDAIFLPLYPELKAREISAVCAAIREFFASAAS
ncbi:MAG: DegT/DnrJ/EryC1/StrS family aminotransferase [Chloroflexi bacterium]|nr:DegT/DnrJ/EryC1/StrS family aminotransferase [Chloroflexota bacterium]